MQFDVAATCVGGPKCFIIALNSALTSLLTCLSVKTTKRVCIRQLSQPAIAIATTAKQTLKVSYTSMKSAVLATAVLFLAAAAVSARELQQAGATAASLTLDFDNSIREVTKNKRDAVINTLAQYVFQCRMPITPGQVVISGGLDTGVLLGDQSVVTFTARCPTANGKSVYDNCVANTKERWFGLGSSVAQREVEKATDTWWPNDKVEIQQAKCNQA